MNCNHCHKERYEYCEVVSDCIAGVVLYVDKLLIGKRLSIRFHDIGSRQVEYLYGIVDEFGAIKVDVPEWIMRDRAYALSAQTTIGEEVCLSVCCQGYFKQISFRTTNVTGSSAYIHLNKPCVETRIVCSGSRKFAIQYCYGSKEAAPVCGLPEVCSNGKQDEARLICNSFKTKELYNICVGGKVKEVYSVCFTDKTKQAQLVCSSTKPDELQLVCFTDKLKELQSVCFTDKTKELQLVCDADKAKEAYIVCDANKPDELQSVCFTGKPDELQLVCASFKASQSQLVCFTGKPDELQTACLAGKTESLQSACFADKQQEAQLVCFGSFSI